MGSITGLDFHYYRVYRGTDIVGQHMSEDRKEVSSVFI